MRKGYEADSGGNLPQSGLLFLAGLCAGAIVGTVAALLFAPRSGSELREQLADSASRAGDEMTRVADAAATHVNKGLATLGEMAASHRSDLREALRF
jgi:gas vesicle protein